MFVSFFRKIPSFVELFGYVLYFGGVFYGPSFFFTDYEDYISGNNIKDKEDNSIKVS